MADYDDLFDDDMGELRIPTMRGSANLDVEDYRGYDGDSDVLDDDLDEDIPSRPGAGAGPAPDIDGIEDYEPLEDVDMDAPGMRQTTYGASPWGPGASTGYRPFSQQRTDMSLRALGDDEEPELTPMEDDEMMHEPEVINAVGAKPVERWSKEWHGNQNPMPSNEDIDPLTLYDRSSYEYDDSSQSTIGSGIFDMEEGATFRPRDGIFANQYAMPAYLAEEDELGVQQSEMWDSTADEWRVTQVSASGVPLKRKVARLKPPPQGRGGLRPSVTGPSSHIEAFGRKCASLVMREAKAHRPESRERFLQNAVQALGPNMSATARKIADRLIQLGYPPNVAFEDALAHCVMHATVRDLYERATGKTHALPRLDKMASHVQRGSSEMRQHAAKHIAPLTKDKTDLRRDIKALYDGPCAQGLGQASEGENPIAPPPETQTKAPLLTTRNLLIAGGVGVGAYLVFSNRKKIVRNIKRMVR